MSSRLRPALENGLLILGGIGYVFFRKSLDSKLYFIVAVFLCCLAYLIYEARRGSRRPADFGLRTDNLKRAFLVSALVFVPLIAGLYMYGLARGNSLPANFYYTIWLYPLWGIVQQLIFQGLFFENLLKLGFKFYAIPCSALFYTMVHWPSPLMLWATFIGGLVFSIVYFLTRNVVPIGIAHGILGALFYYIIRGKDPLLKLLS